MYCVSVPPCSGTVGRGFWGPPGKSTYLLYGRMGADVRGRGRGRGDALRRSQGPQCVWSGTGHTEADDISPRPGTWPWLSSAWKDKVFSPCSVLSVPWVKLCKPIKANGSDCRGHVLPKLHRDTHCQVDKNVISSNMRVPCRQVWRGSV